MCTGRGECGFILPLPTLLIYNYNRKRATTARTRIANQRAIIIAHVRHKSSQGLTQR